MQPVLIGLNFSLNSTGLTFLMFFHLLYIYHKVNWNLEILFCALLCCTLRPVKLGKGFMQNIYLHFNTLCTQLNTKAQNTYHVFSILSPNSDNMKILNEGLGVSEFSLISIQEVQ
jgi:hypothetical protein